jgi:hypothetical protein
MALSLTPPGQPPRKFLALMDKEVDGWKVSLTWPILDAAPSEIP